MEPQQSSSSSSSPSLTNCLHLITISFILIVQSSSGYYHQSPSGVHSQPGLWRSSLSQSSYYYADYKAPMVPVVQKQRKYLPDHPECPDSGRTICKDVPDYPIEHIYSVIKSARANGFNFTSLFVDESKNDLEPNLTIPMAMIVPEPVREKPHVKSYIVYQTSLQYDYLPHSPYQETHHQGFSLQSHQTYHQPLNDDLQNQHHHHHQHQLTDNSFNDHHSPAWDNFPLDSPPQPPPIPSPPRSSSSSSSSSSSLNPTGSNFLPPSQSNKRFTVNPWKPIITLSNVTSMYRRRRRRRNSSLMTSKLDTLTRVKRQSSNTLEGEEICRTRTMYITPRAALSDQSEWKYVVNLAEKDSNLKQVIKVDVCQQANSPCSSSISLPFGFKSRCKQKFIKKKLLSLDPDGQSTSSENFFVPSCCVCEIVNQSTR